MSQNIETIESICDVHKLSEITAPSNVLIIGKSCSGKSTLVKSLFGKTKNTLFFNNSTIKNFNFNDYKENYENYVFVFDDCDNDIDKISDSILYGRQFNITNLILVQYPLGINPRLRSNLNYTFMFKETQLNILKKLYTLYGSNIETFNKFSRHTTKQQGYSVKTSN